MEKIILCSDCKTIYLNKYLSNIEKCDEKFIGGYCEECKDYTRGKIVFNKESKGE